MAASSGLRGRFGARHDARNDETDVLHHRLGGLAPHLAEQRGDVAVVDHVLQHLAGLARVDDPDAGAGLTGSDVVASVQELFNPSNQTARNTNKVSA